MDLNSSDSSDSEHEDAHTSQRQRTTSKVLSAPEGVQSKPMIPACSSRLRTASQEFSLKDPPLCGRAQTGICVPALEAANAHAAPVQTLSPLTAPSPSAARPMPTHSEQAVPQPAEVSARAQLSSVPRGVGTNSVISSRWDEPLRTKPSGRPPNGTNGLSMQWSGPKEAGRWVESEGVQAASKKSDPKGIHGRDTGAYIGLAVSKTFEGTPARTQLLEALPTTQASPDSASYLSTPCDAQGTALSRARSSITTARRASASSTRTATART